MSGCDFIALDAFGNRFWELEQAHHVGDGAAVDFQSLCQVLLGAAMLCKVTFERECFFDGIEIFALQVLDDGEFCNKAIICITNFCADSF